MADDINQLPEVQEALQQMQQEAYAETEVHAPEPEVSPEAVAAARAEEEAAQKGEQTGEQPGEQPPKFALDQFFSKEEQVKFSEELSKGGALSEESLALVESRGFQREDAQLMAGRYLQTENELMGAFGEEGSDAVLEWAKTGLSAEEALEFNEMMDSKVSQQDKVAAIQALTQKFQEANAKPAPLAGTVKPAPFIQEPGGYASQADMFAGMADPRYGSDSEYTNQVQTRVMSTPANVLSVGLSFGSNLEAKHREAISRQQQ